MKCRFFLKSVAVITFIATFLLNLSNGGTFLLASNVNAQGSSGSGSGSGSSDDSVVDNFQLVPFDLTFTVVTDCIQGTDGNPPTPVVSNVVVYGTTCMYMSGAKCDTELIIIPEPPANVPCP